MEAHCGDHLDRGFMEKFADQRSTVGELSRLAVDGDFRRRRGEKETRFGDAEGLAFDSLEKRTFPLLGLSAALCAFASASLTGRTNLFAIMEPFLPVIMRRSGIYLTRIGEDFDYRGMRAPYYLDIADFEGGMRDDVRECYLQIKRDLRHRFPGEASAAARPLELAQPSPHSRPTLGDFLGRWRDGTGAFALRRALPQAP
jgi:N-acyl amino acid synthase of PEP-CTERM/exosortase system